MPEFEGAVANVALALALRAVPTTLWVVFSTRFSLLPRIVVSVALLGTLVLTHRFAPGVVSNLPLVVLYFGVAALPTSAVMGRRRLTRPAALVVGVLIFVGLPALLLPTDVILIAQVFGWDLTLRAYSYAIDGAQLRGGRAFFLLVSPVLRVQDLRPSQDALPRGLWRLITGHLLWTSSFVAAWLVASAEFPRSGDSALDWYLTTVTTGAVSGLALFAAHAGAAGVQIGLLGLVGYAAPERYIAPYRSKTPLDFWRRWNTWVGAWARTYLFAPMVLRLRRRGANRLSAYAIGLLTTFLIVGGLHDAVFLFSPLGNSSVPGISLAFVFHAVLALGWEAIGVGRLPGAVGAVFRTLLLIHILVAMQLAWQMAHG